MPDEEMPRRRRLTRCGLCGHEMTLDQCGHASVGGVPLCHHDTHSCYHRWTVYGVRPEDDDA